jgi:hypothetical protein
MSCTWNFPGGGGVTNGLYTGRRFYGTCFDRNLNKVLLVGGEHDGTTVFDDTWAYVAAIPYVQVATAISLTPRSYPSVAWHHGSLRTVLFGGSDIHGNPQQDTWTFDGTDWTAESPTLVPAATFAGGGMVTDPVSDVCIMIGADTADPSHTLQTWSWDGTNWTQLAPATSPAGVEFTGECAFAWDDAHGYAILLSSQTLSTWKWDGTNWTLLAPATSPSAPAGSFASQLAYHPGLGALHFHELTAGDWYWDDATSNWIALVPTAPDGNAISQLVTDYADGVTVFYGGYAGGPGTDGFYFFTATPPTPPPPPPGSAPFLHADISIY